MIGLADDSSANVNKLFMSWNLHNRNTQLVRTISFDFSISTLHIQEKVTSKTNSKNSEVLS